MKICERHRFFSQIAWNVYVYRFFLCVWKFFANPNTTPQTKDFYSIVMIIIIYRIEWSSLCIHTCGTHLKTKKYVNHLKWYQHMMKEILLCYLGILPPPGHIFSFPFLLVLVLNNNKKCVKYILDLFTHNLCVFFFSSSFIFFVLSHNSFVEAHVVDLWVMHLFT